MQIAKEPTHIHIGTLYDTLGVINKPSIHGLPKWSINTAGTTLIVTEFYILTKTYICTTEAVLITITPFLYLLII